ncbi:MAG: class I SAM-dependent methyltransferase [Polyangiales bacterium]
MSLTEEQVQRLLRRATQAHYDDPCDYDATYARRRDDVRAYVALATRHGGPILELGSGTGRITAALVAAGHRVVGVERHPAMRRGAKARRAQLAAAAQSRWQLCAGDFRRLRLSQRFALVIAPFNALMHLYSVAEVRACLRGVHRHLRRGGHFIFDVLMPDVAALARASTRWYRLPRLVHVPSRGRRYRYAERFCYDPCTQVQWITMLFENPDDPDDHFVTPLAQRQFFPLEIQALLQTHGFRLVDCWGDFGGAALDANSEVQLYIARAQHRH